MITDWQDLKVTVMGLGLFGGGLGATKWLLRQGARVTVTDLKTEEELRPSVKQLADAPIRWRLGGHEFEDFTDADVVVVSPAVPKSSPYLNAAEGSGRAITSEMNLFFERCRGRVIGVTGSNGKTTTAHLTHDILADSGARVRLGGNLGRSLLDALDAILPGGWVVLELSSFQLEDLGREGLGPEIAVVTNLSPNHLDRHGDMESYIRAKKNIVRFLRPGGAAVLNRADPAVWAWREDVTGATVWAFDCERDEDAPGTLVREGWLEVRSAGQNKRVLPTADCALQGPHNVANAMAATAAASAAGARPEAAANALRKFQALPHRMEFVAEVVGVRYYNDSKATTPVSAIAALKSFPEPVILLAGGYDKKVSLEELAKTIAERSKLVVLVGAVAEQLRSALKELPGSTGSPGVELAANLDDAFALAKGRASSGDVVLLSPGCASYGMFNNYEERGDRFRALVEEEQN